MLGCQPDDDAWVLGQSGPALTPEASAALCAWRLQQSLRQLLAVAPLWAASLQSPAVTTDILAAFAGHPWQTLLQQVWTCWRAAVLAESQSQTAARAQSAQANRQASDVGIASELPSLATALGIWQREHERCWQALSTPQTAQLLSAAAWSGFDLMLRASAGVLLRVAPSPLPLSWQRELQAMAQRAGTLSAQALQQPAAPQPGQRGLHWQQHGARLYRYPAAADATPIVLIYAWVNRPDVLDLSPQQSLIACLQAQGLAVWLLDWADSGALGLSLDAYVEALLKPALQQVCNASQRKRVSVLGICQGGTLALSLARNQAMQDESLIASLSLAVTPIDFHTADDRLSAWAQNVPAASLANLQTHSPAAINLAFLNLKPYSLRTGKYLSLLLQETSPSALANFLRLEHWLLSGPLLSGAGLADYLQRFYQRNEWCRTGPGAMPPLQLLIAEQDHIVPPAASLALSALTAQPVQIERLPAGHIGVLVGRQRERLAAQVAAFVRTVNG
ncbi:MAG TPA: alpha/beta fold hydrolase [Permianibacter sp.]|nr:alpha/beta fold hydrolase [Permianibacter sp.]